MFIDYVANSNQMDYRYAQIKMSIEQVERTLSFLVHATYVNQASPTSRENLFSKYAIFYSTFACAK